MTRFLACFLLLISTHFAEPPLITHESLFHPEVAKNGMVVTQEGIATQVGLDILKQNGNAFDAAVAIAYTLSVTLPKAGNLGGGGFMLIYDSKKNKTLAIDFRERAPQKAQRTMFQEKGQVIKNRSRFTPLAVGVPGTVAGLDYLHQHYGSMPLKKLIQPSIDLAENGFPVSMSLENDLRQFEKGLKKNTELKHIFYKKNGQPYQLGEVLKQKDLSKSLKTIRDHGPKSFYEGLIAKALSEYMKTNGGLITLDDLKNYRVQVREAVTGTFHDYTVASMPPPSSGGIHLIQMLNVLEKQNLKEKGHNSAGYIHTLAETMKFAYADRSKHLGDPDYVNVPSKTLTSKHYAKTLNKKISNYKATPSSSIAPVKITAHESEETTHFSIVDRKGNAITLTYTLNFSFGSRLVIPGTGILLNNEMDDFSAKPGVANAYGLIGGEANAVEAGKRPLSSMTPTMVFKNNRPILLTGSPGGSKIITAVLQLILNVCVFDMNIAEASSAPRFHHQWLPDVLFHEKGFSKDTLNNLKDRGYHIKPSNAMGSTQSIMILHGRYYGYADTRRPGALAKGY